jgi:hypothetical protein
MSLIETCKCEECDMQKSFANHWVMVYERNGNLVILRNWNEKLIRRTRHFCGRAHASRYVERWITNSSMTTISDRPGEFERPIIDQAILDVEDAAIASQLVVKYR